MKPATQGASSPNSTPHTDARTSAVPYKGSLARAAGRSAVSELDRLKEQLVYLRFWLGIVVVTEITLVGWLISTPNTADPVLWSLGAVGAVLLGFGIFLLHRQVERRIDQIGRL